MTKEEFQELAETEGFDKAMSELSENVDTLHDEEILIDFVKSNLGEDVIKKERRIINSLKIEK